MRVVLQRVEKASVAVAGMEAGAIGRGLLVLVAFTESDADSELQWMAEKIVGLRIFADAEGKMNLSVAETGGSILVVSQFTLYGDARKGRRPSFMRAASPGTAVPLYNRFLDILRASGLTVATGQFGADMQVTLVNDGPVTIVVDSP
jgi:D-tyrosyl-tRNA(Tyr) deacylase